MAAIDIIKLSVCSLDLMSYKLDLCKIEVNIDPRRRDEGSIIVQVEGRIETTNYIRSRIALLNAIILPLHRNHSDLCIRMADMNEDAVLTVVPRQQIVPMHKPSSEFIIIWESSKPYFVGTATGARYPK